MEYTKGEWKVTQIDDFCRYGHPVSLYIDTPTFTIAELRIKSTFQEHELEAIANAHLIAAAPDMYEALWGMVKAWEELHPDLHPNMAKLALAKAKGVENEK